ncbi:MAG: cobalamin biosynthesis protein CbiD [Nitrospinae bacterium]|nr:cobalamin biosynthesis protein CbiD [Nitrospinota bacterium]
MGKRFYTTGTYAAAATKAALAILLNKEDLIKVEQTLPKGEKALIPISHIEKSGDCVKCGVVKQSVEETDVTHNMEIFAQVSLRGDDRIVIIGGKGIGQITKKGLQLPVGEAAINPIPRKMIYSSIRELTSSGVDVVISAPEGEEIASLTCNPRLGIIGGISILGTTGIMRPKSLSSFKQTILQQLNFLKENGIKEVVITPGNISEDAMLTHFGDRVSKERIVQSGDFLGFTLWCTKRMGLSILLAGHPGKLAKVLEGYFQTHCSRSPPANNAVIKLLKGKVGDDVIEEMKGSPTVEGITAILQEHRRCEMINHIAEAIEERVKKYLSTDLPISILLFNMNRELIGASKSGEKWVKGYV